MKLVGFSLVGSAAAVSSSAAFSLQQIVGQLRDMEDASVKNQRDTEDTAKKHQCHCDKTISQLEEDSEHQKNVITENQALLGKNAAKSGGAGANLGAAVEDRDNAQQSLDEAVAQRNKEQDAFRAQEKESVQAIGMLDSALNVLKRVNGGSDTGAAENVNEKSEDVTMEKILVKDGTNFKIRDLELDTPKIEIDTQKIEFDIPKNEFDTPEIEITVAENPTISTKATTKVKEPAAAVEEPPPMPQWKSPQQLLEIGKTVSALAASLPSIHLPEESHRALAAFVQAPGAYSNYTSQSGQITGIVGQMKQDCEDDLADSRKTEAVSVADFMELKGAFEHQITTLDGQIAGFRQGHGDAAEAAVRAKQVVQVAKEQLEQNTVDLSRISVECQTSAQESAKRLQLYQEEEAALTETIDILDSDNAFNTFQNAGNSAESFIQMFATTGEHKDGDVLPGEFVEMMTKEIQNLIAANEDKHADNIAQKDSCVGKINQHDTMLQDQNFELDQLIAEKEDFEAKIEAAKESQEKSKAELKEAKANQDEASTQRAEENAQYNEELVNNQNGKKILKAATSKLEAFYNKVSLRQEIEMKAVGDNPHQLSEKATLGDHHAPLGLLQKLTNDIDLEIAESKQQEEQAQANYGKNTKEFQEREQRYMQQITQKTVEIGEFASSLEAATDSFAKVGGENYNTEQSLLAIKEECAVLLKNFERIQEVLASDTESLKDSLRILAGAEI